MEPWVLPTLKGKLKKKAYELLGGDLREYRYAKYLFISFISKEFGETWKKQPPS